MFTYLGIGSATSFLRPPPFLPGSQGIHQTD